METKRAVVILAAGRGTRMKSRISKVLHPVGGRPMLGWSIALAKALRAERIVTVIGGHNADAGEYARTLLGDEALVAIQDPPLGTGHAVLAAKEALSGFEGHVVVLYADTPLVRAETVEGLFSALDGGASVSVLGFEPDDPGLYGRLILNEEGGLDRIVEARDASEAELAVDLCNSGVMAARAPLLFDLLAAVRNDNAKGEYYLTDIVGLARGQGLHAAVALGEADEVGGVDSRRAQAMAEAIFQDRRRLDLLDQGVTMIDPASVFLSWDTEIAADVTIEPNVVMGPGVVVESGAIIKGMSHLEGCHIGPGAEVGPFARLRPGARLGPRSKIGNFVEAKNAVLAEGVKASHLTYLGDVEIGPNANIGAGTITCNYDGYGKHMTVIGAGAFIGSDTALVAPVRVGAGAYTGSGSVIVEDVPDDALALGRGKQVNKEGWAAKFRREQEAKKSGGKKSKKKG